MFKFLKSKRPKDESAPSSPISVLPDSCGQHNDVRRELFRVVLKDTLRLHGVPFGLLACEVIIVARAPGKDELHIQLVMMKWNEQLLRYASALQQQLRLGLDRFDPSIDHSRYIFSWRLSPDSGCPFPFMPDPKSWRQSATAQVEPAPISALDRRHTRRLLKAGSPGTMPPLPSAEPSNFAPTQMTPLQ